jgi:cytochrome c peroxidase
MKHLWQLCLLLLSWPVAAATPLTLPTPLGLPPLPVSADNPLTREKIDLGRRLFMDRRLSHNNTMSCAMCHVPEQGFTSNELGAAIGMEGRSLRRNSPALYNVAYQKSQFHDGRETSLENQVWARC